MTATDMDIRKVVLPKGYANKDVRTRWDGYLVEVDTSTVDTSGQVTVTFLNGPERGRAVWLNPLWLMEIERTPLADVPTNGEW